MRVLVAGAGYIGLPLATALVRQGHEVFGFRRTEIAEPASPDLKLVIGDITRPDDLERLPTPFDWVVNCIGARGGTDADYRSAYVTGNRNLLDWLARHSPPAKYVYTSSTGVYGQTDGSLVDETSPTEPEVPTGRILLEAEALVLCAARERRVPALVLRLAGIYGPGRGYWLKQFLSGEARITGHGERILNMVHCDDVVGAVIAALKHGQGGEVYNVVDDEPVAQLALFEWLAAELKRPLPPSMPGEPALERRRGATSKRVSNAKLKRELGYGFIYPTFREGFRELLRAG